MTRKRVLQSIIIFVMICHIAGLLWMHFDSPEDAPKITKLKKVVVNSVAMQRPSLAPPPSKLERPLLAAVADPLPTSTSVNTPPPSPPPPPPKPIPPPPPKKPETAPTQKPIPPKPIATSKPTPPPTPKPTPPKPKSEPPPIAKPTPKPVPAPTPTPASIPAPPSPAISPEKQALLAKAKESLGQINKSQVLSQVLNMGSKSNPDLGSVNLSLASTEFGSGDMTQYETLLATHLKMHLKLPEMGTVTITLTLNKNGQVIKQQLSKSLSKKNKDYVESHISKLQFPSYAAFYKEDVRTFELTLTNAN